MNLAHLYISLLALICGGVMASAMWRPQAFYEWPFQAAVIFGVFALPQLVALAHDPAMPAEILEKTALMCLLCAGATIAAFRYPQRPLVGLAWRLDEKILRRGCLAYLGIALACVVGLRILPGARLSGQQTGLPTILVFFFSCNAYALAIACFSYFRRPSTWAKACAMASLALYFDRVVIAGKRSHAAEIAFIVACAWWFQRRRVVPRWCIIAIVVAMFVGVNGIGNYRKAMYENAVRGAALPIDASLVQRVSVAVQRMLSPESIHIMLSTSSAHELRTAAYTIHAHDVAGEFDLGTAHWNRVVFAFVPAQIVGDRTKASLMIGERRDLAYEVARYTKPIGVTFTGISTAFASFWYFGFLEFVIIGVLARRLYLAADLGQPAAGMLYAVLMISAMEAITHSTSAIVVGFLHAAALFLPLLWLAATRTSSQARHRGTASKPIGYGA